MSTSDRISRSGGGNSASSLRKETTMGRIEKWCYRCDKLREHEMDFHGFWLCVFCGAKRA